jgi:hypothetical protein
MPQIQARVQARVFAHHCSITSNGLAIACLGVGLYLAQETVGLPGLPRSWWEPSRIVTLAVETLFVIVAIPQWSRLRAERHRDSG